MTEKWDEIQGKWELVRVIRVRVIEVLLYKGTYVAEGSGLAIGLEKLSMFHAFLGKQTNFNFPYQSVL